MYKQLPQVPTDAGVLLADKRNGCGAVENRTALRPSTMGTPPQGGGVRASITPNICVQCYTPLPHYLQAFPTSHSFKSPCVRVKNHEHFFVPHFSTNILKESPKSLYYNQNIINDAPQLYNLFFKLFDYYHEIAFYINPKIKKGDKTKDAETKA